MHAEDGPPITQRTSGLRPKLRQGSYFQPFLEPRKTAEALVMVIQESGTFKGVARLACKDGIAAYIFVVDFRGSFAFPSSLERRTCFPFRIEI